MAIGCMMLGRLYSAAGAFGVCMRRWKGGEKEVSLLAMAFFSDLLLLSSAELERRRTGKGTLFMYKHQLHIPVYDMTPAGQVGEIDVHIASYQNYPADY